MSGGDEPAAAPDWVRLRQDYEEGRKPVAAIAAEAGINAQKLVLLARRDGWRLRTSASGRTEATRATIRRLKALLQQRLADLEGQIANLGAEASAASSERDIRSMNTLVRTLEKVLELERKDRAHRTRRRREYKRFDDAEREALALRLESLHREWTGTETEPVAEEPGEPGVQS
ncbi:MAG: hypothetical protein HY245_02875 [Rhizobiales bacterium]|nr:hypothetical protein [Hyphomicrobiales bacterium]MBI3672371.1 hypothetical protein [Hyphomicrobiales bacterium]